MYEHGRTPTQDETAFLVEHAQTLSDDDDIWEILERERAASTASHGQQTSFRRSSSTTTVMSDVSKDQTGRNDVIKDVQANGVHTQTSAGGTCTRHLSEGHTAGEDVNVVLCLPMELSQCHQALHHATDVRTDNTEVTKETSSSPIFTTHPLRSEEVGYRQDNRSDHRRKGVTPSSCQLVCAMVLAILTTVGCGVVAGLAAVMMVIKAKRSRNEARYTEAQQWLNYAFAIIAVSVFFATPVYIYIIVWFHNHKGF